MAEYAPWYRREDYDRIREIMVDGNELPKTYDQWEVTARRSLSHDREKGLIFQLIGLDPDEFVTFCDEKKIPRDSRARAIFARECGLAREYEEHIGRVVGWDERSRSKLLRL